MKLILHIGMPKTGTSTLQKALSIHAPALREAGILYPSGSAANTNHNALSCVLLPFERVHREFRAPGRSPESLRAFGSNFWNEIERQVSTSGATTTVLSSEYLFYYREEDVRGLQSLLRPLFDEIEIVAYVRHPAEFYLSQTQQTVKASYVIRTPKDFRVQYRMLIQRYVDAFDGKVSIRTFEREQLLGGSIVQDFAGRFLPKIAGAPSELDINEVNTTLSAEATCIVQSLRRHAWPDDNDVFTAECHHVVNVLNEIRDESGQSAPRLKPGIDAGITIRHEAELEWLRTRFGVVFNHASDVSAHQPDDPAWTSGDLPEILDLDRVAIDRTMALLLKELAARAVAASRTAPKSTSSIGRLLHARSSS